PALPLRAAPGRSGAAPRARGPAPQGSLCKAGRRSRTRLPGPDALWGPAREDLLDAEPLHRLPRRRERIARTRALQHDDHRLPTHATPAHVVAARGRQHHRPALDPRARGAVHHHEGHLRPAPRAPWPPRIGPPSALPIAGFAHLIRLIQSRDAHTRAPANPKLHQRIPISQARQSGHPLTESGGPSILSGRVGWTARLLGSRSPSGRNPGYRGRRETPGHTAPPTSPWPTAEPLAGAPSAARVQAPVPGWHRPGGKSPASAGDPRNRQVKRESGWPGRALVGTPGDGCQIVPNTRLPTTENAR